MGDLNKRFTIKFDIGKCNSVIYNLKKLLPSLKRLNSFTLHKRDRIALMIETAIRFDTHNHEEREILVKALAKTQGYKLVKQTHVTPSGKKL